MTAREGGSGSPRPLRNGCAGYRSERSHGCRPLARPGTPASSGRNATASPVRGPCTRANDQPGTTVLSILLNFTCAKTWGLGSQRSQHNVVLFISDLKNSSRCTLRIGTLLIHTIFCVICLLRKRYGISILYDAGFFFAKVEMKVKTVLKVER